MNKNQMRNFVADDVLCIVGEEGCLGAGGFGVVQCAFHPSIGWVAVKCFPMTGGKSAKDYVVQQIQNELSALQQANHETILRVYGWAQWEGSIAVITELMPAGSLRLILGNSNVPLHPVLRLRMCKEVSDGTAFIHNFSSAKRLTHGDLKPDNILMSNDLHCKVGDFGSARVVKHTGQTTTTTDGSGLKVQVTLVYAAPERLRKMSCRPRKEQDTFSYGIIVHGVLTRETPDQYSASEEKYLDGIKRGERPDIEAIDELEESLTTDEEKEIIQVLRSVMISCWLDKPTDRPDMRDVRDQLHQLMSKQKQSDVMRSVAEALDKMRIFSPVQSKDHSVPLSCFDSQTKKFEAGASRKPLESTSTDSSTAATIATTRDILSETTRQVPNSGKVDLSTAAATIATIVVASADESRQPQQSERSNSSTAATIASTIEAESEASRQLSENDKVDPRTATTATVASTIETSSDATKQSPEKKRTDSIVAAGTIASTTDTFFADHQDTESSTPMATIACTVEVSPTGGKSLNKVNQRESSPKFRTNQRKPTLKEVFSSDDQSTLPEQVKEAPYLVAKYKKCLATNEFEEADKIITKLTFVFENEMKTSGHELGGFGFQLFLSKRYLESIVFYAASAYLFKIERNSFPFQDMRICVNRMREANKEMVRRDVSMKHVVKDHVIPLMCAIECHMEKVALKLWDWDNVLLAIENIWLSEELIDEPEAALEADKERLARVEKTFKKAEEKSKIYGSILEHLGDLYKKMSRFDDATSCYKQSIDGYKAATFVFDKKLKDISIESCEKKLSEMKRKMT